MDFSALREQDSQVFDLMKREEEKQQNKLSMIPSENFPSRAVREALASVFVDKYAEGYPHKRYYEGNEHIDAIESLCIERARQAFSLPDDWGVNVQALSGSNANLAVYNGLLQPGDCIMGMYLPDGGHLSHGWSFPEADEAGLGTKPGEEHIYLGGKRKVNLTSRIFDVVQYKVEPDTRLFDYEKIRQTALKYRPKMIISGGTAYPRDLDYEKLAAIAHEVGAYYLADIAHEAGLVAGGAMRSPVGIADVVTFTTQKTLRGPRGAIIFARDELMQKINFGLFPGLQGGPSEHTIASIAVCLQEAMQPEFKTYATQVVKNAQHLAAQLLAKGYDVVSEGTDKHLVLVDLRRQGITGRNPAVALDRAGIILNRNSVPNETGSPMNPSGIRLGTPILTTRGMQESEMEQVAAWIDEVIQTITPDANLKPSEFIEKLPDYDILPRIAGEVKALCDRFPLSL